MKILTACLAFILISRICVADDSDDTLTKWLVQSDLVIAGTIASDPIGVSREAGVPHYSCQFKVSDVCKGNAKLKAKTINVTIPRFEVERKDHHPLIRKGSECILFIKNAGTQQNPRWVTADFWFGVQYHSPWMVRSLKRLAEAEK